MDIELERINNVPLYGSSTLDSDLQRWLLTTVDSLNTLIDQLEFELNKLNVPILTATEINNLSSLVSDGILVYDSTNHVYVGKENGSLVQFDTSAYP
jgi:hypothetical protein